MPRWAKDTAIAEHEKHFPRLGDDVVVEVVVDGDGPLVSGYREHNARQPRYRHRVGAVRATWISWAEIEATVPVLLGQKR
jgi:hypothetical protein